MQINWVQDTGGRNLDAWWKLPTPHSDGGTEGVSGGVKLELVKHGHIGELPRQLVQLLSLPSSQLSGLRAGVARSAAACWCCLRREMRGSV